MLCQCAAKECLIQILALEPIHRTVSAERFMGTGKLATDDRTHGRDIECQTETGNDFGEFTHSSRTGAAHHI